MANRLTAFESIDQESHPSGIVWQSPPITSQVGGAEIADTDSDGLLEIIYVFYAAGIRVLIFECEGDNTYVQKFLSEPAGRTPDQAAVQSIYTPWAGDDLVWDLDQDGQSEIAIGAEGWLRIFESTANDVWGQIYADSTGLINSRIVSGGADADGDGVREVFLGGEDSTTFDRKVFVYQPNGDRSFTRVATLTAFDNASGSQWGTLARLEPGGRLRFVWGLYEHLRINVADAYGQWSLETTVPDPAAPWHHAVYAYDLNRNGRDEIYWVSGNQAYPSLILERPTLPTDAPIGSERLKGTMRVTPSPCRGDASVFLDPAIAKQAAALSAFDAGGRLVFHQTGGMRTDRGTWIMPVQRLRPGLYFLRATDALGRPLATGRTTVVR